MPAQGPDALMTLSVALLFAAIFLFGGRAAYRPGQRGRRRFLSFAAGISVAYTFVHVLPGLHAIRELQTESPGAFKMLFPEYNVYLWTMAGFLVFYGLETMVASPRQDPENPAGERRFGPMADMGAHGRLRPLYLDADVHDGVDREKRPCLMPVRGGHGHAHLHHHLQPEQPLPRGVRSSWRLPAGAGLPGGLGIRPDSEHPQPIVLNLVAFVVGGVVVNAAIAELPKEREGRYGSFLAGATVYTALLLALSHFEKGS